MRWKSSRNTGDIRLDCPLIRELAEIVVESDEIPLNVVVQLQKGEIEGQRQFFPVVFRVKMNFGN